jgi:hypothetical protein
VRFLSLSLLQPVGLWFGVPEAGGRSSAALSTALQSNPRHAARTNTNTSAATTIQINAFCGSGGGGRGVSFMGAFPPSSFLKAPKEVQGPIILKPNTTDAGINSRAAAAGEPRAAV